MQYAGPISFRSVTFFSPILTASTYHFRIGLDLDVYLWVLICTVYVFCYIDLVFIQIWDFFFMIKFVWKYFHWRNSIGLMLEYSPFRSMVQLSAFDFMWWSLNLSLQLIYNLWYFCSGFVWRFVFFQSKVSHWRNLSHINYLFRT